MADQVYVLGSIREKNRELVFVPNGESTDLPASAQYAYSSNFTVFPYQL
jgi:hypothetical protein